MMTSSDGNNSPVNGLLWGESTGHWPTPLTKASDAPEQSFEQRVETRSFKTAKSPCSNEWTDNIPRYRDLSKRAANKFLCCKSIQENHTPPYHTQMLRYETKSKTRHYFITCQFLETRVITLTMTNTRAHLCEYRQNYWDKVMHFTHLIS